MTAGTPETPGTAGSVAARSAASPHAAGSAGGAEAAGTTETGTTGSAGTTESARAAGTAWRAGRAGMRLGRTVVRYEVRMWSSLYRWVLRRPRAGHGAVAFGYASAMAPILWAFIVLSAIEVVAVDLLLPWHTVRLVALVLGCYGLVWMVGVLASVRVHPHVLSAAGARIRHGFTVDCTVPWEAVARVGTRLRPLTSRRTVQVVPTGSGLALHVATLSQTNVDLVLREPTAVGPPQAGGEPVTEVRLYVDDPRGFIARAREYLAARVVDGT